MKCKRACPRWLIWIKLELINLPNNEFFKTLHGHSGYHRGIHKFQLKIQRNCNLDMCKTFFLKYARTLFLFILVGNREIQRMWWKPLSMVPTISMQSFGKIRILCSGKIRPQCTPQQAAPGRHPLLNTDWTKPNSDFSSNSYRNGLLWLAG